jgi:hypothetical protein
LGHLAKIKLVLNRVLIFKQKVLTQTPLPLSFFPFSYFFETNQLCSIKYRNKKMQIVRIEQDKTVVFIAAESFPAGVKSAHEKLHGNVAFSEERGYYGISWMEQGRIRYLAAADELYPEEAEKYGLEKFVIKKGSYICQTVQNFMNDTPAIGETFEQMLADTHIDPQGYCLEVYSKNGKDMQCMVKLND